MEGLCNQKYIEGILTENEITHLTQQTHKTLSKWVIGEYWNSFIKVDEEIEIEWRSHNEKIFKILKAEVTVISYKELVASSVLHLQNGNLVKIRNHCIYRSFFFFFFDTWNICQRGELWIRTLCSLRTGRSRETAYTRVSVRFRTNKHQAVRHVR